MHEIETIVELGIDQLSKEEGFYVYMYVYTHTYIYTYIYMHDIETICGAGD